MRSRRVLSAITPVLVVMAMAGHAGAVHAQGSSPLERSARWVLQSSGMEALGLEARPGSWEPRGEEHKHRRSLVPLSLADVGGVTPRPAMRGSPLGLSTWSPYPTSRWPRSPLRAPPPRGD
jgi:hypothetical protein